MLKLRTLLMASAIAACATAAVAQTAAPAPAPADQAPAPATIMVPIPGTDASRNALETDPLIKARVARSQGRSGGMSKKMDAKPDMNAPDQPKQ